METEELVFTLTKKGTTAAMIPATAMLRPMLSLDGADSARVHVSHRSPAALHMSDDTGTSAPHPEHVFIIEKQVPPASQGVHDPRLFYQRADSSATNKVALVQVL